MKILILIIFLLFISGCSIDCKYNLNNILNACDYGCVMAKNKTGHIDCADMCTLKYTDYTSWEEWLKHSEKGDNLE